MKNQKKKVTILGPMGAGKTTFKSVFFDDANPLKLLESSLDPTRDVETSVYDIFSNSLAIWDLAGQEIDSWLGERKDVFFGTDILIIFIDISKKIKGLIEFLLKAFTVKQEVIPNSDLFLLYNKCDLLDNFNLVSKIRNIEQFISVKFPKFKNLITRRNTFKTSIHETFYINTLLVALRIIKTCIRKDILYVDNRDFQLMEKQFKILLSYQPGIWFSISDTSHKLNLDLTSTHEILEKLLKTGYLAKKKNSFYMISKKGEFFSNACKKYGNLLKERKKREEIGWFVNNSIKSM